MIAVAFSPDGKTLATAVDGSATAWLWDVATQQQIDSLSFSNAAVVAVAFSPDGKTLATGSADNSGAGTPVLGRRSSASDRRTDRRADDHRQFFLECGGIQPGRQDTGHRQRRQQRRRNGPVVGRRHPAQIGAP